MKNFKELWKKLHDARQLSARDFIDLAVIKAIKSREVDKVTVVHALLEKYFTPISNKTRMINGASKYECIHRLLEANKWYVRYNSNDRKILGVKLTEFFETEEELALYNKLWSSIEEKTLGKKYVYYFTAQDIPPVNQGVQAGHVLFKLGASLKNKKRIDPDDTYFQWVGVPDSNSLEEIAKKYAKTLKLVKFNESELNNKLTSIAFEPVSSFRRGDLIDYELLKY